MKRTGSLICLLLSLNLALSAQTYTDSLTQNLKDIYGASTLPGVSVAMVSMDKILYSQSFGFADVAASTPFTENTLLNVGSVSKTVIGVTLLKLAEEGKLTLDDPINDYLPFPVHHPRFPDQPITIRHLATHTSGIHDTEAYMKDCYVFADQIPSDLSAIPKSYRKYLKASKDNQMMSMEAFTKAFLTPKGAFYKKKNFGKSAPGTRYAYTNIGAALAAVVVEQIVNEPYGPYTQKNILTPLGLTQSAWQKKNVDQNQLATIYFTNGTPVPAYELITFADGALVSSSHDLGAYLQAIMKGFYGNGSFLSQSSTEEMLKISFEEGKEKSGIFWSITRRGQIGHTGGDPGIFTYMEFNPETRIGHVFVTNCSAYEDAAQMESFKAMWIAMLRSDRKLLE